MRNISFAMTKDQVRRRAKDVTRRDGWHNAKPGEKLQGCEKCQGLGKGGKIVKMDVVQLVSIRFEPLRRMLDDPAYGREECRREGFPDMTPLEFCEFYMRGHKGVTLDTELSRLEFRYLD